MKNINELLSYNTFTNSFIIIEWDSGKKVFDCNRKDLIEAVGKCIEKYEKAGLSFTVRKETSTVAYLYKYDKKKPFRMNIGR